MGQQLCCYPKVKMPTLDEDLHITNEQLLEEIEELRIKYRTEIEQSKVYAEEDAIFRGKKDKDKKKYGYGQYYLENYIYLGLFQNSRPNGRGLAIKSQEEFYRGNFKDGHFHGYGKEYGQGYSFEGQFENDNRKRGTFKNKEILYKGPFLHNNFEGQGVLSFQNGVRYEGSFVGGKMQGKGVLFYPNGKIFKGELVKDKCKKGKFEWANEKLVKESSGIRVEEELKSPTRLVSKDINTPTKGSEMGFVNTQRTSSDIVSYSLKH